MYDIFYSFKDKLYLLIPHRRRNIKIHNRKKPLRKLYQLGKQKIRGYSTIEQQVIRKIALEENSYRYTYRRKIFVEYIYNRYLFLANQNQKLIYYRTNRNTGQRHTLAKRKKIKTDLLKSYKYVTLTYYYKNFLNTSNSIEELTKNLSKQSRVDQAVYDNILKQKFTHDFEENTILILESIETNKHKIYIESKDDKDNPIIM